MQTQIVNNLLSCKFGPSWQEFLAEGGQETSQLFQKANNTLVKAIQNKAKGKGKGKNNANSAMSSHVHGFKQGANLVTGEGWQVTHSNTSAAQVFGINSRTIDYMIRSMISRKLHLVEKSNSPRMRIIILMACLSEFIMMMFHPVVMTIVL